MNQRSRRRGFTLFDAIIMIGVLGFFLALMQTTLADRRAAVRDQNTADQARAFADALHRYVRDNQAALTTSLATPSPYQIITHAQLVAANYLPRTSSPTNPFNQTHVGIATTSMLGVPTGYIVTVGGRPINETRAQSIAAMMNGGGAAIAFGTNQIRSTTGAWTLDPAILAAAGIPLQQGHLVVSAAHARSKQSANFVSRFRDPIDPDANSIYTPIDFADTQLRNVGMVATQHLQLSRNMTITGSLASGANIDTAGSIMAPGVTAVGLITAGGTTQAQNAQVGGHLIATTPTAGTVLSANASAATAAAADQINVSAANAPTTFAATSLQSETVSTTTGMAVTTTANQLTATNGTIAQTARAQTLTGTTASMLGGATSASALTANAITTTATVANGSTISTATVSNCYGNC